VNGDNVTWEGLWVEHFKDGYPSLKINDNVQNFTLNGFVTAARFSNGCDCFTSSAIETPVSKHVTFHGVIASSIEFPVPAGTTPTGFTVGGYLHIFNDIGPAVDAGVASGTLRAAVLRCLRDDRRPGDRLVPQQLLADGRPQVGAAIRAADPVTYPRGSRATRPGALAPR
jgi:hypothetical protein